MKEVGKSSVVFEDNRKWPLEKVDRKIRNDEGILKSKIRSTELKLSADKESPMDGTEKRNTGSIQASAKSEMRIWSTRVRVRDPSEGS